MKKYKYFIVSILIITLILLFYLIFSSDNKIYYNNDFDIDDYVSLVDFDNDGIDDQTDILQGAINYINTKPKYKSKYYATGYPNDEYGVCTDVVANAFKEAGYDLMELVYEDIVNNRGAYNIDKIDTNIDFRRVRNLKVFFKNKAISLSTDVKDIEEFQGGDIVIFDKHIAIVSNKRNKKGIPYIIHHANPWQKDYEEDKLDKYKIVGHYRWN